MNLLDYKGGTALHWACFYGNEHVVNFLVSLNVEINAQDFEGLTPLHLAVLSGNS